MRRQISGLGTAHRTATGILPDGLYLVRVQRAFFQRQAHKPYYTVNLAVLGPTRFSGQPISGRLYCTRRALWKLNWFLRDFGYDCDELSRDEVDETQLVDLKGVVKVSRVAFDGSSLLRFDGFAPASSWETLSPSILDSPEVA
jgi:hypothetical protein